ncbi:MAG: trigger factor [Actinomycetota bacterium]
MTETAREVGRFERHLTLHITEAEIDAAKTGAARRLSKDLKLHGFRPGKAPRPVVEAAIGANRLRTEAIEDLIPQKLGHVLAEENISPAITPALERINEVEGGIAAEVLVTLWPEIDQIPKYKDRTVEVDRPELTEAEIDQNIERMRHQFASLETADRAAGDGDFVSINIGAKEGANPVEQTTADELLYEVGSGMLVEGIDDHLRGSSAGDVISFDGVLPGGFGERAGTAVTYSVTVNEVKARVLPAVDDEWVEEVTEFETVDALRAELAARLAVAKRRAVANQFRQKALDSVVDEAAVEIPEALIQTELDDLFHRFAHRLEDSDITIADYLSTTGISEEQMIDDLRREAHRSLRTRLVLETVAKEEGITVEPEEVARTIEALTRSSKEPNKVLEAFSQGSRALSLAGDILRNKALEVVISGARAVDSDGNPVFLEADAEPEAEAMEVEAEMVDAVHGAVVEAEIVEEA